VSLIVRIEVQITNLIGQPSVHVMGVDTGIPSEPNSLESELLATGMVLEKVGSEVLATAKRRLSEIMETTRRGEAEAARRQGFAGPGGPV
jgi:hypothetical protein